MFDAPRRPRTGALLFLPVGWQRVETLKWLKRVHAWTGLWGAALFLLLGVSGFLLNHRTLLKIDTGAPVEVSRASIAVPVGSIRTDDDLSAWTKARFGLAVEGRAPPADRPGAKRFLGRPIAEPATLARVFTLPDTRVIAEHVPGSGVVTVKRESIGLLGTLKNLHKGTGLPVAWVLLLDTIAGALVAMSLTGFLLWSRLHGPRLLAGALAGGSLLWAVAAAVPAFG